VVAQVHLAACRLEQADRTRDANERGLLAQQAIEAYEDCLRRRPPNLPVYVELMMRSSIGLGHLSRGEIEQAEPILARVCQELGNKPAGWQSVARFAWGTWGQALALQEKWPQAKAAFEEATRETENPNRLIATGY